MKGKELMRKTEIHPKERGGLESKGLRAYHWSRKMEGKNLFVSVENDFMSKLTS